MTMPWPCANTWPVTGPPVRLQTLELNPAFVDDRLLSAMARAGFVGVGVTAESAADPALAGLQKPFTEEEVRRAAAAIRRSRLPCFWMFMLGGPGETTDTVKESLRFAQRTLRPGDVAYFNVGIRIYPGTELENIARQEGVLSSSVEEMLAPAFYFSPALDYEWTLEQVRRAAADHLSILHSGSLSHPWLPKVNRLFSRLPLQPAHVAAYPGHPPGGAGPGPGYLEAVSQWSVVSKGNKLETRNFL